jgi:hypothetical protein
MRNRGSAAQLEKKLVPEAKGKNRSASDAARP